MSERAVPAVLEIGSVFGSEELKTALAVAAGAGASDVFIQSDEPVRMRLHGRLHVLSSRELRTHEISALVSDQYGSNGSTRLLAGNDLDYTHTERIDRGKTLSYRVNGTPVLARGGQSGIELVFRTIPSEPPKLVSMGLEPELFKAILDFDEGIVLIVGTTGSGKSTTLAAVFAHLLENVDDRIIRCYESPAEFTYWNVRRRPASIITQSEVPRHLESFDRGVRNSLRRTPTDIMVGELRDRATIEAGLTAAITGHRVWATAHAKDAAATVYRLINAFEEGNREVYALDLIQALHLIVVQRLVPSVSGGRVALREWCHFAPSFRDALLSAPLRSVQQLVRDRVIAGRTSLADAAQRAVEAGTASEAGVRVLLEGETRSVQSLDTKEKHAGA
ncbi:MAG: ATPase [Burkholderiales bacterium]|nr:MAG: ATPase [Burkholderiales bacterium]